MDKYSGTSKDHVKPQNHINNEIYLFYLNMNLQIKNSGIPNLKTSAIIAAGKMKAHNKI